MQKSSAIPKSTISYNVIKKTLVGLALGMSLTTPLTYADQILNDDYIVKGSICVGLDCTNGENFNFDTIRLKENNTRIRFVDSSSTGSFPSNDWQLTANDSGNGGANKFSIEDITGSKVPFTLTAGAPSNSIFVTAAGNVGFNTGAPLVNLHVKYGNSPTLRLDQDASSGFAAQAWDVGGNETNFFVRDVTNSSQLPLRIRTGAPNGALYVDIDGDIGFETTTPDGQFDIAHYNNANDHALLVSPVSHVGINIANGHFPLGLFDISTAAGKSGFLVQSDGKVGFGTGSSAVVGRFDVRSLDYTKYYFNVDDQGDIGIGTSSGTNRIDVKNNANTADILALTDTGRMAVGTGTFPTYFGIEPTLMLQGLASTHHGLVFDTPTNEFTGSMIFAKAGAAQWMVSSRNEFSGNGFAENNRLAFLDSSVNSVFSLEQGGKIGFGVNSVAAANAIEHSNGARLTTGGVWQSFSSREAKKDISDLSLEEAQEVLLELAPVTYEYIKEPGETYVGFIAEDVPDLVATNSRDALGSMDVVAVLTKVVQQQQTTIKNLNERLDKLEQVED